MQCSYDGWHPAVQGASMRRPGVAAVASAAGARVARGRLGRVPLKTLRQHGRGGDIRVVSASDGTMLHVEIDGPENAPLTVIFCHGVTLNLTGWRKQREALAGSPVRRVF